MRLQFLVPLTIGLVVVCARADQSSAPPAAQAAAMSPALTRPNILFIFTDDHATHAISAYGSKINKTPNIDRLAREGMIFHRTFCTNSICGPSRAVILTGKHSHLNGFIDNGSRFNGEQTTFPKLLRSAGYQTAIVGKWHLVSEPTGFDFWEVLPGQGAYYNPDFLTPAGRVTRSGYCTELTTDRALEWLERTRDKSKPFLLMLQHKAPHRDWQPGPRQLGLYRDGDIPEPATLFDDYAGRASPARYATMTVARHLSSSDLKLTPPRGLTAEQLAAWNAAYDAENQKFRDAKLTGAELVRWKYQRYIKDYLRCVAGVDDSVGRVLDYLDRSGLSANTVVIYSSDQGFYLGDHGWFDKRWMYEESLRMPLIVRWPNVVKPGSENRHLTQNLDFAETFLEIAGVPVPAEMQGRSLVPLLRGEAPADWRKSIYYHYYEFPGVHDVPRHCGVRTERHKLIHYYQRDEWELFDLETDPHELRSVYDDPAYAAVRAELTGELARLQKHCQLERFTEPPGVPNPAKVATELVLRLDAGGGTQLPPTEDNITPEKSPKKKKKSGDGNDAAEPKSDNAKKPDPKVAEPPTRMEIVAGRADGKAYRLDGRGALIHLSAAIAPNPAYRPLLVGTWVHPDAANGVLVSHGNQIHGYALYLEDGHLCMTLSNYGVLTTARSPEKLPTGHWSHVAGRIDREGQVSVLLAGKVVNSVAGGWVCQSPREVLSVGGDAGQPVGPYKSPNLFRGLLQDVRLYWGEPESDTLAAWLQR